MKQERRAKIQELIKIFWVIAGVIFLTALVLAQGFDISFSGPWSGIVLFLMFLCAEAALLLQTILNRNKKKDRIFFFAKLAFIFGLFVYSVADLIIRFL